MLYVLGWSVWGPLKIGITGNLRKRMKAIKTACPYPVKVFLTGGGSLDCGGLLKADCESADDLLMERMVHDRYKTKRMSGEWFDISIRTILKDDPYFWGKDIDDQRVVNDALHHIKSHGRIKECDKSSLVFYMHWDKTNEYTPHGL